VNIKALLIAAKNKTVDFFVTAKNHVADFFSYISQTVSTPQFKGKAMRIGGLALLLFGLGMATVGGLAGFMGLMYLTGNPLIATGGLLMGAVPGLITMKIGDSIRKDGTNILAELAWASAASRAAPDTIIDRAIFALADKLGLDHPSNSPPASPQPQHRSSYGSINQALTNDISINSNDDIALASAVNREQTSFVDDFFRGARSLVAFVSAVPNSIFARTNSSNNNEDQSSRLDNSPSI